MSTQSSADRIRTLAASLSRNIDKSTKEITAINSQTRLLSLNARIEAARAGELGKPFSVISSEMLALSERTRGAAAAIDQQTRPLVNELSEISELLSTAVRGTRLCDLAHNNINLVDRNLYERSCDCRWWATDSAAVDALAHDTPEARQHASNRLGVILKAYTVYYDIVLADANGVIVANGRAGDYASVGQQHAQSEWFKSAWATADGDSFGFQSAHASPLVGGKRVLVYSCKVCEGGVASQRPLGVLGVIFNWDALAQTILAETPLEEDRRANYQLHFVDAAGRILASSERSMLDSAFEASVDLPKRKACVPAKVDGRPALIAHAPSVGFETYKTGWSAVIVDFD